MKKHPTSKLKPSTRFRLAICAAFFLSLLQTLSASAEEILQVFLQGATAAELADLVKTHGGSVTHSLHIIDAVGAKLTGKQLADVVESPLVSRFIDDLADSEVPGKPEEEEDAPPCRVRGHIELDFVENGVSWRLYNKYEKAAALRSLTLDWPDTLGEIKSLRIGETTIAPSLYANAKETALALAFPGKDQPVIEGMERLDITFTSPPTNESETPAQREFNMEAAFVGPCSTKLVPGYENNHEDYYYNTAGGVDELHKQGLTGKGVTVAIIDSGLWEHELLRNDTSGKNRLLATYDAITDTEGGEALDESGHGTHMASIIANSGKTRKNGKWTGTYKGVAPDANLVAVKVLDRQGLAHLLDIVRGVQWVVDNRKEYQVKLLNLSFSQTPLWAFWQDPVNQAIVEAWRQGITVVAAAGNNGPDLNSIGSPGNIPRIITVGAITDSWTAGDRNDDYLPNFSSRGPTSEGDIKPDIVALGGHITGLIPVTSMLASRQPEDLLASGEYVSTGTSQASAFVTGVSAMLLELFPGVSPDELKCILVSTAKPAIKADGKLFYAPYEQGTGLVSIRRAILFSKQCETLRDPKKIIIRWPFYSSTVIGFESGSPMPSRDTVDSISAPLERPSIDVKWGLKAHIESLGETIPKTEENLSWKSLYEKEQETVRHLSNKGKTDENTHQSLEK